ncbi:hypothetical protein LAZ67_15000695 [Cordylochernes scorpioides]|uniref:ENPP1-3/EXOG-like endonuclease/phosphodiesterase domain-containing protein n=1 Tax=Cordylochernes scorpioides TaxID=51811 RepID=A0ABY6LA85_9ARAC|nr:hypothetical protein LAZ67_15000695 [Cordylochernes scorpioides]
MKSPYVGKYFNRGIWNDLEMYVRNRLVKKYNETFIITGPMFLPRLDQTRGITYTEYQVIGKNYVAVPTHFFKVALGVSKDNDLVLESYLLPNQPLKSAIRQYLVPKWQIEKMSGLLLFDKIPLDSYRCEKVLDCLQNRFQCFLSVDRVCENVVKQNKYFTEFLNSITSTRILPKRLNLNFGAIFMLLRNLNPRRGTRMVIQRMLSYILEAQILTGTNVGRTVLVPKLYLAPSDTNLPSILKSRQLLLRLAFAMTINKTESQTFARVGLLLQELAFTHGLFYIDFSRVRTLDSIRAKLNPRFGGGPGVVNPTPPIERFLAQRGFWERGDELQYASLEHPTHALLDSGPEI